MKVLLIETGKDGAPSVLLGADSAVLRCGEPVFVPEPLADWHCRIMPAVRISRLGMHISAANVARHVDSVSLFHVMMPVSPLAGVPSGMIDRTFSPGEWIPAEASGPGVWSATRKKIGGEAELCLENTFSLDEAGVADTISRLSRYCTFRTGDVLLFADAAVELGAPILDTCVEARLADKTVLSIRIK